MRVAQLWRFPVKSLQGGPVDAVELGERGVAGDRGWGIVDPAAGKVLSAKRWPQLLLASATVDDAGGVSVTLPDGSTHAAGDPAADEALSAWLGFEVGLRRPPPGPGLPFEVPFKANEPDGRTWDLPGPAGGPFVDYGAAHLLTTASLRAAAALHPAGDWDVRRFRPTVLVDTDGDGFVEDGWLDREVQLGDAALAGFKHTGRCGMPARPQPGLPADVDVNRTLRDHHDRNLGIYCHISRPGTVRIGDAVTIA